MDISTIDDIELETYITEVMLDIGVPAHLKGYYYLRDAIMMTGRDMDVVSSVTKLMYPVIARRFKTTDQKVERAIRNAIEVYTGREETPIPSPSCSVIPYRKEKTVRPTANILRG